ncbi:MAG: choice-of-anchor B family protein [Saprospiraceae bacterium]
MKLFKAAILFLIPLFGITQATKLKLLGHWRDPLLQGSAQYDNTFNEAYGFTVNDHEYAVIGSTFGTHIIDITDPTKPTERMRIKGGTSDVSVIHRDFRYYDCHLYAVCDEGEKSSLQIIDVSRLPDTAVVVYDKNELFYRSHNIFIDETKARLYTCSEKGTSGFFALGLYDISNPELPIFLNHYNTFGDIQTNHIHDCFVRNDTAYLNGGYGGLAIMDFANYKDPKVLYTLKPNEYAYSGYNHSGWLTPDGKTYVMADETHGALLKVFDLSDFSKIKIVSYLGIYGDSSKAIPHNPLISCKYAYVSYYYDGLQVYDISNPKVPLLKYYYPTSTEVNYLNYKGAWGTFPFMPSGNIIVADMQNGMFIVEGPEKVCKPENVCIVTNTKNEIKSTLQITPNPFTDAFKVQSEKPIEEINVLNLQGKVIYQKNHLNQTEIVIQIDPNVSEFLFLQGKYQDGEHFYKKLVKVNVQ